MQPPPFPLMEHSQYASPLGILQIGMVEHTLAWIGLPDQTTPATPKSNTKNDSISMQQVKTALDNYFHDASYQFDLSLFLYGTPFQKKVWQALQTLQCNETLSYSELALRLKTHPRAIGNACRTNRIPIVIPCHRILAKSGLGGYAGKQEGKWPQMKIWLLEHEGYQISSLEK